MFQAKLRMLAIPFLAAIVAVGAGFFVPGTRTTATALNDATDEPDDEPGLRPGIDHVDRLDLGKLQVGALAEAEVRVWFKGVVDPGLAIRVDRPDFVTVKDLRVLRRGVEQPGGMFCSITLTVDTKAAGKRSGKLRVRLGDQVAKVPIVAVVTPTEPGRTKVLVVSSGFGSASSKADYYRPWFDLVDEAKLDVSYKDCYPGGLRNSSVWTPDRGDRPRLAEELARYDVILLAEGGTHYLRHEDIRMLKQFVGSGKRLIVTASTSTWPGSVLHANLVLDLFGMTMVKKDAYYGFGDRPIEDIQVEPDPLTKGIKKLTTDCPVPIHVLDADQAKILAFFPRSEDGFVAVSRQGEGEVVAISLTTVSSWIGKYGEGADNARFLRNLLSNRLNRRDNP